MDPLPQWISELHQSAGWHKSSALSEESDQRPTANQPSLPHSCSQEVWAKKCKLVQLTSILSVMQMMLTALNCWTYYESIISRFDHLLISAIKICQIIHSFHCYDALYLFLLVHYLARALHLSCNLNSSLKCYEPCCTTLGVVELASASCPLLFPAMSQSLPFIYYSSIDSYIETSPCTTNSQSDSQSLSL